jgi:hypothetical protein
MHETSPAKSTRCTAYMQSVLTRLLKILQNIFTVKFKFGISILSETFIYKLYYIIVYIQMNVREGAMNNRQSKDTGNIVYKKQNKDKQNQKHNTEYQRYVPVSYKTPVVLFIVKFGNSLVVYRENKIIYVKRRRSMHC